MMDNSLISEDCHSKKIEAKTNNLSNYQPFLYFKVFSRIVYQNCKKKILQYDITIGHYI